MISVMLRRRDETLRRAWSFCLVISLAAIFSLTGIPHSIAAEPGIPHSIAARHHIPHSIAAEHGTSRGAGASQPQDTTVQLQDNSTREGKDASAEKLTGDFDLLHSDIQGVNTSLETTSTRLNILSAFTTLSFLFMVTLVVFRIRDEQMFKKGFRKLEEIARKLGTIAEKVDAFQATPALDATILADLNFNLKKLFVSLTEIERQLSSSPSRQPPPPVVIEKLKDQPNKVTLPPSDKYYQETLNAINKASTEAVKSLVNTIASDVAKKLQSAGLRPAQPIPSASQNSAQAKTDSSTKIVSSTETKSLPDQIRPQEGNIRGHDLDKNTQALLGLIREINALKEKVSLRDKIEQSNPSSSHTPTPIIAHPMSEQYASTPSTSNTPEVDMDMSHSNSSETKNEVLEQHQTSTWMERLPDVYQEWQAHLPKTRNTGSSSNNEILISIYEMLYQNWNAIEARVKAGDTANIMAVLTRVDTALYWPLDTVQIDPKKTLANLSPTLIGLLIEAQHDRRETLQNLGLERIEAEHGTPRIRNSEWAEDTSEPIVPAPAPDLKNTLCRIRPGKGGYRLNGRLLRPTEAVYYASDGH